MLDIVHITERSVAGMSVVAVAVFIVFHWAVRRVSQLPKYTGGACPDVGEPSVTVVIAARNEEENLRRYLPGFLRQRGVARVVLIDDNSSDRTRAVAEEIQRADSRLHVMEAPALPEGWIGKSHALHFAAQTVNTRYVLFTDADIAMAPQTVCSAVAEMEQRQLDHLSGFFKITTVWAGERLCAPILAAAAVTELARQGSERGAATGAFNMIRASFYLSNKGHIPIRTNVVDDVALAQHVAKRGGRTAFYDLSPWIEVRMFSGIHGFMQLLSRTAVTYMQTSAWLVCFMALGIIVLGLACMLGPLLWAVFTVYSAGFSILAMVALLSYVIGLLFFWRFRRYHDVRVLWMALYPLPIVLMGTAVLLTSLHAVGGGSIAWRGREYLYKPSMFDVGRDI